MPNHVTNVIAIQDLGDSEIAAVRAAFLNDQDQVDFNVIKPMPDCLKDFNPHSGIITLAEAELQTPTKESEDLPFLSALKQSNRDKALAESDGISTEDRALVEQAKKNHKECGHVYWYSWANEHWGTKWNAYSQPVEGYPEDTQEFSFDTAWSHPAGLIRELSLKAPLATFRIRFADEDLGSNCGEYTIKNGEYQAEDIAPSWSELSEEGRQKWLKFAFSVRYPGEDPRSHGYDENWSYSDEVYDAWEAENES